MKRKLSLFLVSLMMFGGLLAGCGGGDKGADPAPTEQANKDNAGEKKTDDAEKKDDEKKDDAKTDDATQNEGVFPATDPAASPAAATNRKDTLIVGMTAPKGIFNPFYGETAYDNYVIKALFNSFTEVQKDGTYANSLAEKIDVSDDGLKYTFHLKPGIKYSDGTPMTVKDYVFAVKVLCDGAYDGPSDMMSVKIKGAQEYHDGKAKDISGIKVIDDNTVEVTVLEPQAMTKDSLGTVWMVPESYYGKGYKQGDLESIKALNNKPIGSGQYVLTKFAPGQEVDLTANPNYFLGAPKVKNVVFKTTTDETKMAMLQSGETDMDLFTTNMEDNLGEIQSSGFFNTTIFPTNGYGYVAFNIKQKRFQDVKVRQALVYGLNRKEIVEGVYGKYADVINIPQSKVSWAYTNENINPYEFNMDKAKQLLDEAGWKVGADGIREKDGEKFKINFSAQADNTVVNALIPIMTQNYKELGIDLVSETLDFNAIMDKKNKGDYEMYFAAWGLTADPDTTIYITNGAQNKSGYSNKKVDDLMEKARKELDQNKRKELYKEMYQVINNDVPCIFMYQRRDMWPINARVKGFDLAPYKDFSYGLYNVEIPQ
ncbi:ABC transporter substrate-binding protein [Paenibacillus azoreducens]|uniref:Peptide-binding protein n=2 Tax=Paenibacillus azoreducens TaxID=116718 RepID=A0A919YJ12_9BACL|nr:peptide-binding protein [Paenibacillus azoreducens]